MQELQIGGTSSLARRLFLTAAAVTLLVLLVIGLILSSVYQESVERAFDRHLNVYLKSIVVDVAESPAGTIPEPAPLGEPLFQIPLSGWYWQIVRTSGETREMRTSPSAPQAGLPSLEDHGVEQRLGGFREGYATGPDGEQLRVVEQELDLGEDGQYLVMVAADAIEIDDEIAGFNFALLVTFGLLALVFIATAWFQIRFGLRPLKRISESLHAIRTGRAERLEGNFPEEVAPLAGEVNALIEQNREIVTRARTHVGNLAHALKTPISVLLNESVGRGDALAGKVREQVGMMREQVQHHLNRARIAARVAVPGALIPVAPVLDRIVRTMEKLHRERAIAIERRIVGDARFHGEQQDIEEIVGNLVDNACKWANSRVEIELSVSRREDGSGELLRIVVDDDGPGLAPDVRSAVMDRGLQLDDSKPGSGLGLSIVRELAELYGGRLELGTAPLGGLRAELLLPAAIT